MLMQNVIYNLLVMYIINFKRSTNNKITLKPKKISVSTINQQSLHNGMMNLEIKYYKIVRTFFYWSCPDFISFGGKTFYIA
jgi:hypothetical protein